MKTTLSLVTAACLCAGSMLAQTASTSTTTTATTTAATTTNTTATAKTSVKKATKSGSSMKTRVANDASRLAGLLRDAQTTSNVESSSWKTVSNEANSLANRLYGETSGNATARKAALNARTHVREFRKAAQEGDAAAAREHANQAMPFLMQLIDWAT